MCVCVCPALCPRSYLCIHLLLINFTWDTHPIILICFHLLSLCYDRVRDMNPEEKSWTITNPIKLIISSGRFTSSRTNELAANCNFSIPHTNTHSLSFMLSAASLSPSLALFCSFLPFFFSMRITWMCRVMLTVLLHQSTWLNFFVFFFFSRPLHVHVHRRYFSRLTIIQTT